jgi:hypothetical protein
MIQPLLLEQQGEIEVLAASSTVDTLIAVTIAKTDEIRICGGIFLADPHS